MISAAEEKIAFYQTIAGDKEKGDAAHNTVRRDAFRGQLRKVLEGSSFIIHVLDARSPEATRCRFIAIPRVRMVVLAKADLVPPEVVRDWVRVFRSRGMCCIPFSKGSRASSDVLIREVKKAARGGAVVGVIGMPNVGKSTIVNALARRNAASVAPVAGHTRALQEVKVTGKIRVLDSPGVLPTKGLSDLELVLLGAANPDALPDPVAALEEMKAKASGPVPDAVEHARARGFIGNHGILNLVEAAKDLLRLWARGHFPYYTLPPQTHFDQGLVTRGDGLDAPQTELVPALDAAFDVDALIKNISRTREKDLSDASFITFTE